MRTIIEFLYRERLQYLVLLALSFGMVGLTGILCVSNQLLFQRFLGRIHPLLACFVVIFLAVLLFSVLLFQGWFAIYTQENLQGLFRSCGLAALFGVLIILVDLKVVFPADMNVRFPQSLLFYQVIGFFVEMLFHVLPLMVLLLALTAIFKQGSFTALLWMCILIVSLLEPLYQTMLIDSSSHPLWVVIFVGLHVFFLNVFQLLIFKHYDFISMYSFRLVYYLFWHIAWGYLRLKFLF